MTPKEQAEDLIGKIDSVVCGDISDSNAKTMAHLICDEIIISLDSVKGADDMRTKYAMKHFEWVKEEIDKSELWN